jgi:hypothetical protein
LAIEFLVAQVALVDVYNFGETTFLDNSLTKGKLIIVSIFIVMFLVCIFELIRIKIFIAVIFRIIELKIIKLGRKVIDASASDRPFIN